MTASLMLSLISDILKERSGEGLLETDQTCCTQAKGNSQAGLHVRGRNNLKWGSLSPSLGSKSPDQKGNQTGISL